MQLPAPNIAAFPGIEGNLAGISEVRLELQLESPKFALYHLLDPDDLRRRLESMLMRSTIVINPFAKQALVVGIYVESREVVMPNVEGHAIAYFVSSGLREMGVLTRSMFGMPAQSVERVVDSWRHKGLRGLATSKISAKKLAAILFAEVELQIEEFIAAWRRDAGIAGILPLTPQPLEPRAGRQCHRISLGSVDGPAEEKQEAITVANIPPATNSEIAVRMSRTVRTDLYADICGPSALVDSALPELTRCAQEAASAVTLAAIAQDSLATTEPFRREFLLRLTQLAGPLAATPSVALVASRTVGPWQWFQ